MRRQSLSTLVVFALCLLVPLSGRGQEPRIQISYRVSLTSASLFEFGPLELASPTVTPDGLSVVVGTSRGDLYRMSTADGSQQAHRTLVGGVVAAPLMVDETLVVGTNDGKVYRLALDDFEPVWEKPAALKGAVVVTPTVIGNTLLIQDDRSVLQALSLDTGVPLVAYDGQSFSRRGLSPFTIFGFPDLAWDGTALYAGFETGVVIRFEWPDQPPLSALSPRWEEGICSAGALKTSDQAEQTRLCSPRRVFRDVDASPAVTPSGLLTGCYCRGLVMLDPATGAVTWEQAILGPSSPVVVGDKAAVTSADGQLYAVSLAKGKVLWTTRLDASLLSRPAVVGASNDLASAALAVATGDSLYFVNGGDGTIAGRIDSLGGIAAAPTAAGNALFVLSNQGHLYRIDYFR